MQKAIEFLERNVQWFALGLGGLFLLWVVYAFVLTPPVAVSLKDQPKERKFAPGEVEDQTVNRPGLPVCESISNAASVECGSIAAWVTSLAMKRASATRSASAKPFSGSPKTW